MSRTRAYKAIRTQGIEALTKSFNIYQISLPNDSMAMEPHVVRKTHINGDDLLLDGFIAPRQEPIVLTMTYDRRLMLKRWYAGGAI